MSYTILQATCGVLDVLNIANKCHALEQNTRYSTMYINESHVLFMINSL
jgi:hypothetical protein